MKRQLIYLSIFLLCCACNPKPVDLGIATAYFPSSEKLREGFVYKYYLHQAPKNTNDEIATNIQYRSYQFIDPDILQVKIYDAGFDLNWYYKYQVRDDKFRIMDSYTIINQDTIFPKCRNNIELDWVNQETSSVLDLEFEEHGNSVSFSLQTGIQDTLFNDKNCKMFSKKDSTIFYSTKGDTTTNVRMIKEFFGKNIGFIGQISEYKSYTNTTEVIERMSFPEFRRRSKHNRTNIGYIDPYQTLDDHSDFKLCKSEAVIREYYSCKKRGELKGGKGAWWRVLRKKLKPEKLKNESGFLTYRFVINCQGATGRFVVIGADLDYNEKEFNKETVEHLYDIVSKETDWQHCHGNYWELDSYAYITFKLKDGEIIELLP